MKKLFLALALLAAAPLSAQSTFSSERSSISTVKNPPLVVVVDYTASQTWPSALLPPCGSNGAPTWRAFCDGDGVVLSTGTTTGNPTIAGKVTATNFEVPASANTGYIGGVGLGKIIFATTDGRVAITKNTPDGSVSLNLGNNATATNALIGCSTTECVTTTGSGGTAFPWRFTQWRLSTPTADTAASVALSTTSTWSSSYRPCDATSNTVAYTLPASSNSTTFFYIKKFDTSANPCTITRAGSDLIDGLTTITLASQGDYVILRDGSNTGNAQAWAILGGNYQGIPNNTDGTITCTSNVSTRVGAQMQTCSISELVTIAAAATSVSANNLLQANSTILGVELRVTVAIPTAATFQVGSTGDAGRFCGTYGGSTFAAVAVAANTTSVCNNFNDPTGATATGGPNQLAAGTILITPNATPGTAVGRVRITVYFIKWTPPTA